MINNETKIGFIFEINKKGDNFLSKTRTPKTMIPNFYKTLIFRRQ
jgi:hypothetical protein